MFTEMWIRENGGNKGRERGSCVEIKWAEDCEVKGLGLGETGKKI